MKKLYSLLLLFIFVLGSMPAVAQDDANIVSKTNYSGLKLRNIGPALTSGRIADIAVNPNDENVWYVGVASGGVWKTTNDGTSWKPIFDHQSSYSIGTVTIDPNNSHTIWVGTGENVGGRHMGYGDGVYKSTDDGKTWKNMGLKESEHISKIIVKPGDPDVVWVASQGPLWSKGGQRGVYKTTDGGQHWKKVLGGNEWTGATDLVMDPRNPDVLYAATWQHERTTAAYLGGGPGSGIYKSTDGGDHWTELKNGIPGSNLGKIGLAISPQKPDVVYAAITLNRRKGAVFMSDDRGESWKRMSNTVSGGTGPHYYQELYASPHHFGRIYLMDVRIQVSDDNGAHFHQLSETAKHSDNHAIAFRKDDPNYLLVGSDGGLYETYDMGKHWRFINNMPITQFYKLAVDDAQPFYNVYGGAQDNGSQMGPSRTANSDGIRNADWHKTFGADGYDTATEPGNPNIFYVEYQKGNLYRVDRKTGDQVFIQPQAGKNDEYERFNWDAPIEISPHNPKKLLFASQRVWISKDRGDSWTAISGDLTRHEERITLPIMGKERSWDNPWDVFAMSNYNTITSLVESPKKEGLIYAGTDDGLLQVTEDGGEHWRRIDLGDIKGVPSRGFVNDVKADLFDVNTVYIAVDNHKNGDYTPYLLKSTDRGKSWKLISKDLPDRHIVWRMVQDDKDKDLLFAATEFGIFFTVDGGQNWQELKGGVPTIPFRDLVIQRDKHDLVGASFGRGFFILDNYTPLRQVDKQMLNQEAKLFTPRDTYWYVPDNLVGSMGANHYSADNPPFGTVFTYYLKDGYKSLKQQRQAKEKKLDKDEDVPFPGWDELDKEIREQGPKVVITIKNKDGNVVNRVTGPTTAGFHRVNWELRYPSKDIVEAGEEENRFRGGGFMVTPGTYTATLSKVIRGKVTQLSGPVTFEVKPLQKGTLERKPNEAFAAFRKTVTNFQQDLTRATNKIQDEINKVKALQIALSRADKQAPDLVARLDSARHQLLNINDEMNGSDAKQQIGEHPDKPSPRSRLFIGYRALSNTYGPTETQRKTIEVGQEELNEFKQKVDNFAQNVMPKLEQAVRDAGAPPVEEN